MMVLNRHCLGYLLLALSMLWALSGCRSGAPEFPPTEETVRNAAEELGWTLDLDQSATHSISEDQIIYNLVTEEQMNISVGCTEVEGERVLTVSSIAFMLPDKPEFSWANGEKVVTLAETLYGFDQGALYQALSEQDMPERSIPEAGSDTPTGQESLSWVTELPAGYARVRWIIAAGATEHTFPEPIIKNWRETFIIALYKSKEAYVTSAVIQQEGSPEPVDFGIDFKTYEARLSAQSNADLSDYFPVLEDGESFLVGRAPSEGERWAGQETTLDRFRRETKSMAMYAEPPKISSFALCDMDQDGEQELVLAFDNAAGTFLILHRNGDGFQGVIQYAREFQALQTNGIYTSAGGAAISECQRMTFENGNVQITTLAYAEDVPGEETFLIGEKEVTRSEYDDWVNENSPGEVTWEV